MALHYDGFEQFAGNNQLEYALRLAGYGVAEYGRIAVSIGRYGGFGIGTADGAFYREYPWEGSVLSVGTAIRFDDRGAMFWVQAAGQTVVLWTDGETGNPHINGHRCGSLPVPVNFYYYELELDKVTGTVRLFVNGRPDGEAPLPAGMASATEAVVGFGLPDESTTSYPPQHIAKSTRYYDDIYLNNGPRLGPVTVTTRFPNLDGDPLEWYPSTGSAHAMLINRTPPEMNNAYIVSDEIGATDLFYSYRELVSNKRIISTGLVALTRKSPEFEGRLRGIVGDDVNAAKRSDVVSVEEDWRMRYIIFPENGSDTKEGIEMASFGVQVAEP